MAVLLICLLLCEHLSDAAALEAAVDFLLQAENGLHPSAAGRRPCVARPLRPLLLCAELRKEVSAPDGAATPAGATENAAIAAVATAAVAAARASAAKLLTSAAALDCSSDCARRAGGLCGGPSRSRLKLGRRPCSRRRRLQRLSLLITARRCRKWMLLRWPA